MTKKQYTALQPYEKYLRQAYYHNYINAPSLEALNLFQDILREITGDMRDYNKGCGACQLKLAKRMGELYFKYVEENVKKEEEETPTANDKRLAALEKAREARKKNKEQKNK